MVELLVSSLISIKKKQKLTNKFFGILCVNVSRLASLNTPTRQILAINCYILCSFDKTKNKTNKIGK